MGHIMKCFNFLFHTRLGHLLRDSIDLSIFRMVSGAACDPLVILYLLLAAVATRLSLQLLLELRQVVRGVLLLGYLTEFYHV